MSEERGLLEAAERYLTRNYRPAPVVFARGRGCELWDVDGRRYLDLCAGIAVCVVGHSHPVVTEAIARQAGTLVHVSNLFHNPLQIELASKLCSRSLGGRAFFCNSGAEANEALLKIARRTMQKVRGRPERVEIVAMLGSFHGRTIGALSVTGQAKYRDGFGPLWQPVKFVPYADLGALEAAVSDRTCAVLLEPLQGEGGIVVPPPGTLRAIRELCTNRGALMLLDEVQTGMGRTGSLFAYQRSLADDPPDGLSVAKGLAGGVPMGAILVTEELARGFEPGTHASTFGGNLLASAAALATLEVIDRERLCERAGSLGERLRVALEGLVAERPAVAVAARGEGLLQGLVMDPAIDTPAVVAACREKGVLLSVAGGNVVRFSPPLVVTEAELDEGVGVLRQVLASPPRV
ncbi:MAG: aspartate aminotransferase family protein [Deltaproteobacteria bacterium]|nr:aspartate aminotransferase family protein [Deltaproteobacteria bacterium]